MRVTLKNGSTTVAKTLTAVLTAAATSAAFVGNDGATDTGSSRLVLTSGTTIASVANSAGNSSDTLNYVAGYSDIEAPVTTTSTAGTTVRVSWLGV